MAWFSFIVCGENYLIKQDNAPPELLGFHTVRYVEATNVDAANAMMFEIIRTDEYLNSLMVEDVNTNPTIRMDEIKELDGRPNIVKSEFGDQPEDIYWHFFPMNEDDENE